MNKRMIFSLLVFVLFTYCKKSTTSSKPGSETFIQVINIIPAAQSVLSEQDTISADISYFISDEQESDFGFKVGIVFSSTDPNQNFAVGSWGQLSVTDRRDTVTVSYPLSAIWSDSRLQHPVSCYYYLRKYTSTTASVVIVKTDAINYQE